MSDLPPPAPPPDPPPETPEPPTTPETLSGYEITNRGSVFGAGYGPDFYGVWDLREGGEPIERFPLTSEGWQDAWALYRAREKSEGRAGWRRPRFWWVVLHVLIAWAIGLVVTFVGVALLVATGWDPDAPTSETSDTAFGLLVTGIGVASIAGWLLFVYLAKPVRVRAWWLVGPVAVAAAAFVITGAIVLPKR